MKAMVLAAGIGMRLRPLTETMPKALVPVGGRPMLEVVLRRLKAAGVREAIVNIFHLPEKVEGFLRGLDLGLRLEVSKEEVLLDTGGGLKKAGWFFDDGRPFFLHNVDVYSTIDLEAMLAAHKSSGALATLAVSARPGRRRLVFDREGLLRGREAGTKGPALAFNGIHVVSPALLPLLKEEGAFSMTDAYLRLAAEGREIRAFRTDPSFWADVGSPEGLADARRRAAGRGPGV